MPLEYGSTRAAAWRSSRCQRHAEAFGAALAVVVEDAVPQLAIGGGRVGVEVDGATEVEEPHVQPTLGALDQVVAGVGVGVEEAVAERRTPCEPHDRDRDLG